MSKLIIILACPRSELKLSLPKELKAGSPVCYCCREYGIICADNHPRGRTVISKDGLGPVSIKQAGDIETCWQNNPGEDDGTYQIIVAALIPLLEEAARKQVSCLEAPADPGNKRGFDSEQAVAEILFNRQMFPWILCIEPQPHNSDADYNGIDLVIQVDDVIAQLLDTNKIQVQVKSNPKFLELFLNKLANKRRVRSNEVAPVIIKECFVFLNGGAGAVSEAGVFVPFIAQLFQLIYLRSGSSAAEQFLQILHPALIQKIISLCANGVLWRDYKFLNIDGCIALLIEKLTGERMLDTGPTLSSKPQGDRTSNGQTTVISASQPRPSNGNGKNGSNGKQKQPEPNRARPPSRNRNK